MCDFCGAVTGGAAAQVAIRMDDSRKIAMFAEMTGNQKYLNRDAEYMTSSIIKDACESCLKGFLVTPRIQIGGHPFKDEPDADSQPAPE
jgi:hypothetical protein